MYRSPGSLAEMAGSGPTNTTCSTDLHSWSSSRSRASRSGDVTENPNVAVPHDVTNLFWPQQAG